MKNQIAIITGGSRGLGRNAALDLARRGVDVILTYRSQEADARSAVAEIEKLGAKALALQLDTADVKQFDSFVTKVGTALTQQWHRTNFDFLVNNAGTGLHALLSETTEDQFDEMMNVHIKGVFFLTQKLVPLLADGGRILNTSSGLTRFTFPGAGAYAAMKGAVEVLTRYQAKELGSRGITVNTIAPGAIATDFRGGAIRDNKELSKMIGSQTALGRVGMPDDIGGLVASFLTGDNGWVNGQRIEASGGMFL